MSNHEWGTQKNFSKTACYYAPMQAQVNYPIIAEWVKILITAVVGFASAVCLDLLKNPNQRASQVQGLPQGDV
jgi:hypothetical protein